MNYIKQTAGKPHFEDLLWSKPETKALAGKLLIIGGNKFGISSPSDAFRFAQEHGAGEVKVVLPDCTKKLFGPIRPQEIEFAKSTPSGSFSKESLSEMLAFIGWADAVLLAGDFSRSSETGILIEELLKKSPTNFIITRDALDYFTKTPSVVLNRPNTTIVASFAQLQSLLAAAEYKKALKFSMPNNVLTEYFTELGAHYPASIITSHQNYLYVIASQQLSITEYPKDLDSWRLDTSVKSSVWLMQNPQKPFEALTTACAIKFID